jgi:hypothetical protein
MALARRLAAPEPEIPLKNRFVGKVDALGALIEQVRFVAGDATIPVSCGLTLKMPSRLFAPN